MNSDHIALLQDFLNLVGIPANVEPTEDKHCLITIPIEAYEQQQAYINAWFTPLAQENDIVILMERMRGLGDTDF